MSRILFSKVTRSLTFSALAFLVISLSGTYTATAEVIETSNDQKIISLKADLAAIDPDNIDLKGRTSLFLIYAYEEAGQVEIAREKAKELAVLLDQPMTEKTKAYSLYRIISAYTQEGDYAKAYEIVEQYREGANADTETTRRYATVRALAEVYESLGYYERSAALIEEALTTEDFRTVQIFNQDMIANNLLLANQYVKLGQPELALLRAKSADDALTTILETRPDANQHVLSILSMKIERAKIESLMLLGQYDLALSKISQLEAKALAFDRAADLLMARAYQAKIYVAQDRFGDAKALLGAVVNSDSFNPASSAAIDIWTNYAIALEALGDDKNALRYMKDAETLRAKLEQDRLGSRSLFVAAEINNAARLEQLNALEMDRAVAAASAQRSTFISFLSLFAAALACVATFGFYKSWKAQKSGRAKIEKYASELKVSEALATENALKANAASEAKTSFLANMSHEIRTPMNGVLGMAEVLQNSGLNKKQYEYANIIKRSGESLLTIINDILDFSKIEAGKLEFDPTPANLRHSIEDVTTFLAGTAVEKNIKLLVRYAPDVPSHIVADIGRIRQILVNLVGNAIKFTKDGCVVINISGRDINGNSKLRFEIIDTGIGIPADRIDAIFDDFNQAENSITRQFGGTGLGLAITKRLVEAMGSQIFVESTLGKGSVFKFDLSFPTYTPREQDSTPSPDLNGSRALIVNALPLAQEILAEQLRGWSVNCQACANGAEALEAVSDAAKLGQPYDYILLDDSLGDMSAYDCARTLRAFDPTGNARIILMYSAQKADDGSEADISTFSAYVMKPHKQSALSLALTHIPSSTARVSHIA